jgi:hypothetical protein
MNRPVAYNHATFTRSFHFFFVRFVFFNRHQILTPYAILMNVNKPGFLGRLRSSMMNPLNERTDDVIPIYSLLMLSS